MSEATNDLTGTPDADAAAKAAAAKAGTTTPPVKTTSAPPKAPPQTMKIEIVGHVITASAEGVHETLTGVQTLPRAEAQRLLDIGPHVAVKVKG